MKRIICLLLTVLPAAALIGAALEPPKMVTTSPTLWAVGVNPSQKNISLTFDQPMIPGFTAWLGRSSLAPEVDLNSTVSEDRRTFEMKVGLQPGKVYVFGLNEKGIRGVGFQTDKGASLPPTFLVFQTAGSPRPEDAPPQILRSLPPNGAQQLDPARTKGIVLTFNKPMRPDKHGLHLFENNKPVDLSKARFGYSPDGKTFTLYYDFRPSQIYRAELNTVNDIGFASANRIPLWPVQLSFSIGTPR